ncbi:L-threonylcarbamoyladenylate synthase [Serinibacter salmoneus]|uniref:L-threonylcarbamoyladenylate synthase n=1 Tax=Serinibacter salmoneus TaxID=556530 RepID=A0A2A9D0T4_9MICO|nr:translation factor SUA5 [Serinibacter salmoneus]
MTILPCTPHERSASLEQASRALREGGLVVLPTDTVYGIAADAFDPDSVRALLAAKGRGRQMPPPVLVGSVAMLDVLGTEVTDVARALAEAFWPGALTLIVRAQPSLVWDLGETRGTVALRMPDNEVTLELLGTTGPLAVSSANRTGLPAATTAQGAREQLGARVGLYLDDGTSPGGVASTIVDVTTTGYRILRAGGITEEQVAQAVAHLVPAAVPQGEGEAGDGVTPTDQDPQVAGEPQPEPEPVAQPDGGTREGDGG